MYKAVIAIVFPLLLASCSNDSAPTTKNHDQDSNSREPNAGATWQPDSESTQHAERQFSTAELYEFARIATQTYIHNGTEKFPALDEASLAHYKSQIESNAARDAIPELQECINLAKRIDLAKDAAGITKFVQGVNGAGATLSFVRMLLADDADLTDSKNFIERLGNYHSTKHELTRLLQKIKRDTKTLDSEARPNCWGAVAAEMETLFLESPTVAPSNVSVAVDRVTESNTQELIGGIKIVSPAQRHAITVKNNSTKQLRNVILRVHLTSVDEHFSVPAELTPDTYSSHVDHFFIEEWNPQEVIDLFMEGAWPQEAKRQTYSISYQAWSEQLRTEGAVTFHQNYLNYLDFVQNRCQDLFQKGELESAQQKCEYWEFISRAEPEKHNTAVTFLEYVNRSVEDSMLLFQLVESLGEKDLQWRLGKHQGKIGLRITEAPKAGQSLFGPTAEVGKGRLFLPENPTFFSTFEIAVNFDSRIGRFRVYLGNREDGIKTPNPYSKYASHDYNDTTESKSLLVEDNHNFSFYFYERALCGHGSQGALFSSEGNSLSDRFDVRDDPHLIPPAVNPIKLNIQMPEECIASQLSVDNYPPLDHSPGEIKRFFTDKFDTHEPATGDLVWSVDFSNLRPNIYSDLFGQLAAWDTTTGKSTRIEGEYFSFKSTASGEKLFATHNRLRGGGGPKADIIDAKTGRTLHQYQELGRQYVFSHSGTEAYFAGHSPFVRLLEMQAPFSVQYLAQHRSNVNYVCLSHNEEFMACQYEKTLFSIWKRDGNEFQNIGEYSSEALANSNGHYASAAHPTKPLIVTISYHGDDSKFRSVGPYSIEIWNYLNRELVYQSRIETAAWSIMLSNDWKWLFLGLGGGQIAVIDTLTGKEDLRLTGHNTIVSAMRLSSDQRFLLSGTYGDWVILWGLPERLWLSHAQTGKDGEQHMKVTQDGEIEQLAQPEKMELGFNLLKQISNIKNQLKLIEVKKKRSSRRFYEKHIKSAEESFNAIDAQADISASEKNEVETLRVEFHSLIED